MYHLLSLHTCGNPTESCPHCGSLKFKRHGTFYRREDHRKIPRFYCKECKKTFSRSGYSLYHRHKHRHLTEVIRALFANGCTIRGIARIFKIDRGTVARRLVLLAQEARHRESIRRTNAPLASTVQFDDMFTIEHTKLKPLSITVIGDADRWKILGFTVAKSPATGKIAQKSREKYGPRPDESVAARDKLFAECKALMHPNAEVKTDQHTDYPVVIKKHLPEATHQAYKGGKAAVVGQGELKKLAFDPLFCINHQLAMFRANVSRLFRRSWNTTKHIDRLSDHLAIFVDDYNRFRQPKTGREYAAAHDE